MVSIEKSITVNTNASKLLNVVTNFNSYPDFLPEMKKVKIIKSSARSITVTFDMNLMQQIKYTLKFDLKKKNLMPWSFVEGDSVIKDNSGFWKIEKLDKNLCDLTYHLDIDFNIWLPSSVIEMLLNDHLPRMLEKFKQRAEGIL
jgi:ribosome-associated toxin RatA of RatAB toxin-antitoxin module